MHASSAVAVASTSSYPKIFWGQCDRRLVAVQARQESIFHDGL